MSYYKVVSQDVNGMFFSSASSGEAKVQYKVGEWTLAPRWLASNGYHLFVFDDLRGAEEFQFWLGGLIYEVLVGGVYKGLPRFLRLCDLAKGCLKSWKWGVFPSGTKMVKRVKLMELVN